MQNSPHARKRFIIAVLLGIFLGFVCAAVMSSFAIDHFWGSSIMWSIVADRFLIGVLVAMAGVFTVHPIFGIPCPWYLRGAVMWIMGSLPVAASSMGNTSWEISPWNFFLLFIIAGVFYGVIIDFIATRWAGEGKKLLG